ncbi:MAG: tetratricopeptide repeat protein [Sandarakinorhabdus sp.]|nr:tetratricopeptide repeat protein [Sandarakinorhabdus sp.]
MLRFAGMRASLAAIFFLLAVQADRLAAGPAVQQASVPSLLGFIDSALAEGRLRAAQDLITRARAQSDDPEVRLREAELLLASAVLPAALAAFEALESEAAVAARAGVGKAVAELRAGRETHAAEAIAAALAKDPGLVRGWIVRGVLADRRRDWKLSETSYGRAIALDPGSAAAFNNRGYARLLQGRYAEAEADLVRAIGIDGSLAAAQTNLRLARAMQGRYAEAFLGSRKEDLARDLNIVGFAAMSRGDHALAESYFSRALEISGHYDRTASANLAYLRSIAPGNVRRQVPPE